MTSRWRSPNAKQSLPRKTPSSLSHLLSISAFSDHPSRASLAAHALLLSLFSLRALQQVLVDTHGEGTIGLLRAKCLEAYDSNPFQYFIAFLIILGFILDISEAEVNPQVGMGACSSEQERWHQPEKSKCGLRRSLGGSARQQHDLLSEQQEENRYSVNGRGQ